MSRKVLLLALLLAAGCSNSAPPAVPAPETSAGNGSMAVADCPQPRYSPLPPDAVVDQDFFVRNDRVNTTRSGALRRRTSLELMGGEPKALAASIAERYVANGFRRLEVAERGDGVARFAVIKRGFGRINISAMGERPRNPSHPASVGVINFDWPIPGGAVGAGRDTGPEAQGEDKTPPQA
jgi:hypothetical protein